MRFGKGTTLVVPTKLRRMDRALAPEVCRSGFSAAGGGTEPIFATEAGLWQEPPSPPADLGHVGEQLFLS